MMVGELRDGGMEGGSVTKKVSVIYVVILKRADV